MLRTALFFLLQGAALAENHVFVSPNGSDVAPGNGSATFPFRTLAHALETDPQSDVTLLLLPGTFESAADSHLSVKGQRSVSIVSTASEVVIDLTSAGSPWLQVEDDAGAVLVANLTIRNGWGGSSISISGNQTKIIGVQFRNNTSPKQGGAIYLTTGSTIQNCSFVGNSAPSGGAVSTNEVIRQGGPLILDSLFDNNEAVTGGGAISLLAVGYVINCVFTNNRASLPTLGGGGIFLNGGISIRSAVMNCTFVNNTASGGGGALVLESYANVSFCSFSNNSAGDISRGGGAVLVAGDIRGNKQVTLISDCYFHNNFATNAGGALELAAVGSVVRCHFDSNQVTTFGGAGGGAIFIYSAVVPGPSIVDSLFTNNYGAGVAVSDMNNSDPDSTSLGPRRHGVAAAVFVVEGIPAPGPLISNSKFLNSSESGALVLESPAQIENCTFAHNFAKGTKYGGGAIVVFSVRQSVPPVVRHCCFYDNGAETGGGAIYTYSALQIEDTVFTQNSATIYGALFRGVSAEPVAGGAVAVDPHAPGLFLARNVTFSSNTADKGGALFLGATSNVVGSTFEKNTAQSLGGAAVIGHDDVAFIGCIFTRNMAPKGSNLLLSEESAVNLQLSALCDHARNSIECVGNGSNGTIVGTFSSSLPHSDIAPAPCRIRDDHIVLPIEFNPTRLDTVWYFAVCGYQDSFLRLRRRVGAVVPEAALTALTMVLDSDPQASLSVTKPLPNSSSIEELMTESAYTHHARVQEGQHQASLSITNLKNGKCLAGCFPEFGVLISSPPTRVPTEYTRFVLSGQVEGISLSPAQSRVHILGGSIAFVGLTVQLLVQLRDDVGRPYASLVHIVHGNKRLACDGDSSSSALLLCTFTFETESLHATLELEDQHGNKLGRIGNSLTVISLVWPILGGALAFLALVSAVSLWAYRGWKRRRQHIADRLLQNYVGLDRGPTKEKQGWFGGGSEAEPYLLDKSMLIPFSDIDVRRDIASGAAGKVSLGTWRGMSVAVKKLYVLPSGDERQRFCAELSLHKTLRHRNVVQLLGVCSDPLCMVLEFMERGSLFACLRECDESELPWPLRLRCALDVARGMAFLHAESILHRDLKSLNVLVNEDWRCKVADFDQSRVDADTLTATVGTVLWSAPEVLMGRGDYGKEADVYSFGIVMWECWTREAPFQGPDAPTRHKVREHIISGKRPECSAELGRPPAEYDALMTACYSQDMGKRPTFPSIVSSLQVGVDGDMLRADDLPYGRRDTGTTASWSVHRRGTGSTASASDRLMLSIQSDEASFPSVPSVPEPRGWRRFLSFRSRAQDPKSAPLLPVAAHAQGI